MATEPGINPELQTSLDTLKEEEKRIEKDIQYDKNKLIAAKEDVKFYEAEIYNKDCALVKIRMITKTLLTDK